MRKAVLKYLVIVLALVFSSECFARGASSDIGMMEAKLSYPVQAGSDANASIEVFDKANARILSAIAVQNSRAKQLMSVQGVVGIAVGINDEGQPAIQVYSKKLLAPGAIPGSLDGIPVVIKVSGDFSAMRAPGKINPAVRFARPVPIGVSTGNAGECSSGTIGARVMDAINVYALSNNHVYADSNSAPLGSQVLQPGLYDTSCTYDQVNVIGNLANFVPINYGGENTIDAALAVTTTSMLGNSTPQNGYGVPMSATAPAVLGQFVQKYGRTTALTKGIISGINATIIVNYGAAGNATFVNQIIVHSNRAFIKAGDSGSLLVNDPVPNPVGLLFAGNSSGQYGIANPIDAVLSSFGVTIDGR
ncbi:MAG TPA: hypothetical protein DDW94_05150 [Deltaproteobacteria bacterium]|nr:MAG: hypothetical protein A2Z79_11120 [Deltaproteobacteria bacterium GWA2_55_82]OGQ64412.1 MAG: hypothetical protein A3I81_02945 [Deltaproteobacteria bacterium RIFCSPLOWO2_02_FULL_55_12]OIJ72792.1 MAG: hypothetical protein A2V21_300085 [Deltaproteobacteria bacterium GWC2_55_46]HBG46360.1 hypothetical protein [Deltaproteobacteria bacterium]HCY11565.1 hypothetical protein [Deltaproteobacteria bacterium]